MLRSLLEESQIENAVQPNSRKIRNSNRGSVLHPAIFTRISQSDLDLGTYLVIIC